MEEVDLELVRKFKNYLEFEAKTKHGTPLSQNSRHTYFNKFKACLGLAFREKVIKENIADYIDSFKQGETHREHLTFEELEKLAKTPCTYPNLKNAFLFSCLTGMRWSDINTLHWKQIRYSESNGYEIVFKQQKTGGQEYLPINDSAFDLLPERGSDNDKTPCTGNRFVIQKPMVTRLYSSNRKRADKNTYPSMIQHLIYCPNEVPIMTRCLSE